MASSATSSARAASSAASSGSAAPPSTAAGAPPSASFEEVARGVTARYRARGARVYVRMKLKMDPIARVLLDDYARGGDRAGFGRVLDVGCGRGQLPLLLLSAGAAESALGLDWDEEKIRLANDAADGSRHARFEHVDVAQAALPEADTLLLIDILHYLTHDEQDAVLARAASAARERIFVRDLDPDAGASSVLTQSWEWVTTNLGFNRGARVLPRTFEDIARPLASAGFDVSRAVCSARGLSNTLLVAVRR